VECMVLVIADERDHDFYRTLSFGDKRVETYSFTNLCDCMKDCKADIILLDCNFELEVGLTTLKNIKAVWPAVPVILLADISFEELVLKAFKAGARDFFKKPVNVPELQDTVMGLLKMKRKSKETRFPFMEKKGADPKKLFRIKTSTQSINLSKAIRFIEDNLAEGFDLDGVAHEANTSRYHFCRFFKKRVGISPMRFVTYMRVEKAKKILGKAGLSISEVASDSGFNDTSSFIKQFKKITGITPTNYRKSIA
jgi:YesN/AraC family two-component response regulator